MTALALPETPAAELAQLLPRMSDALVRTLWASNSDNALHAVLRPRMQAIWTREEQEAARHFAEYRRFVTENRDPLTGLLTLDPMREPEGERA